MDIGKSNYDLLQNDEGNVLLIIQSAGIEPENPRLVYDGGECAVLYRSRDNAILLKSLEPAARVKLAEVDEILVAEYERDGVVREYKTPVRMVSNLHVLMNPNLGNQQ